MSQFCFMHKWQITDMSKTTTALAKPCPYCRAEKAEAEMNILAGRLCELEEEAVRNKMWSFNEKEGAWIPTIELLSRLEEAEARAERAEQEIIKLTVLPKDEFFKKLDWMNRATDAEAKVKELEAKQVINQSELTS